MSIKNFHIKGLTDQDVLASREKYGSNTTEFKKPNFILESLKKFLQDPLIIILLLVSSSIYFITGETADGIFLLFAILFVSLISLYQDTRSRNALEKLKAYTKPKCKVIRNGIISEIKIEEIVIGDSMLVEEGTSISADGIIVYSNDFSANEAILTGESFAVHKDKTQVDNQIFQGTTVASGMAIASITAIGTQTKLGKIGKSIEAIPEEKTALELKLNSFVKKMAFAGLVVFLIVLGLNYFKSYNIIDSLLKALTLALSILPEEIPVAFTTFMAIGAWRMMKKGIIVKQTKTVETLGSATVICIDKTGTITENKMTLAKIFSLKSQKVISSNGVLNNDEKNLIELAMFASEPIPFDPMEMALHNAYSKIISIDERLHFKMIHEYPLSGKPPMMTHIFKNKEGKQIIVAKGAPEALMNLSNLSEIEKQEIENAIISITTEGYRILGVAEANFNGNDFPKTQQEFQFTFKGLVSFYDPPKKNIHSVLQHFYTAGINVKIITGDYGLTTTSIAKQIGFHGFDKSITGNELMKLSEIDLKKAVSDNQIFTRMFPEAKLKIINALKSNGEIVAMTGDGVNDGPALKSAHIGIAMGERGTEIAKQTASLILVNDDLSTMVDAVAMGRRIYTNIKKAIQFVISIHIPIILIVFIPLALGWVYPNIFSPIHIAFLELVMDPTCSIVYENEPMEKNTMSQKPKPFSKSFFNIKELSTSILQGLMITVGLLLIYQYAIHQSANEDLTRTMVFTGLVTANIFLTLVNRSFYYSILTTFKYKNKLVSIIVSITIFITGLILFVPSITRFFQFQQLTTLQLIISIGIGFLSVIWYEFVKLYKRKYARLYKTVENIN
jgi:P-type Ca2+ transporter type 2C